MKKHASSPAVDATEDSTVTSQPGRATLGQSEVTAAPMADGAKWEKIDDEYESPYGGPRVIERKGVKKPVPSTPGQLLSQLANARERVDLVLGVVTDKHVYEGLAASARPVFETLARMLHDHRSDFVPAFGLASWFEGVGRELSLLYANGPIINYDGLRMIGVVFLQRYQPMKAKKPALAEVPRLIVEMMTRLSKLPATATALGT